MKRLSLIGLVLALLLACAMPAAASDGPGSRTYTIEVGWEDAHQGVSLMGFFPNTLQIHLGDTIHWHANSFEIHTVTFAAGQPLPQNPIVPAPAGLASPLMLDPRITTPVLPGNGQYDGSTWLNSGIMGLAAENLHDFNLTFTRTGKFDFICLIHGEMMSGTITVVDQGTSVPPSGAASARGKRQISHLLSQVGGALKAARAAVPAPEQNADGTTKYHVLTGYDQGQIGLMRFFPDKLDVKPNDTVEWHNLSGAPHTVTFLNGAPAADLGMPVQYQGQTLVLVNPAVLFPSQPGPLLTRQGIFSSGLMLPAGSGAPFPSTYTLTIGNISGSMPYVCLIHDDSGMQGELKVKSEAH